MKRFFFDIGANANSTVINPTSNLIPLDRWREDIGKTAATIWRWRQRGWIEVQNICGRLYVSRVAIAAFEARAAAGEFSKTHKTPTRTEKAPAA